MKKDTRRNGRGRKEGWQVRSRRVNKRLTRDCIRESRTRAKKKPDSVRERKAIKKEDKIKRYKSHGKMKKEKVGGTEDGVRDEENG